MRTLAAIVIAVALDAASAFIVPMTRSSACTRMHATIPDSVRNVLSEDQIKTLEAETDKAMKAAGSDMDPWFVEAVAEENSFFSYEQLEDIATPKNETEEALVAEGEQTEQVSEDGTTPLPQDEDKEKLVVEQGKA